MNLWSRDIECSDELLLTGITDCLLFQKAISSCLATSCLIAQYKTYGAWSRAHALMIYKWDADDIHEWKRLIYAKLHSHALVHLSLLTETSLSCLVESLGMMLFIDKLRWKVCHDNGIIKFLSFLPDWTQFKFAVYCLASIILEQHHHDNWSYHYINYCASIYHLSINKDKAYT